MSNLLIQRVDFAKENLLKCEFSRHCRLFKKGVWPTKEKNYDHEQTNWQQDVGAELKTS